MTITPAGWASAQPTTPNRLTADDYMEIQQLYQAYQRGVDGGDRDSSWMFTSDGSLSWATAAANRS